MMLAAPAPAPAAAAATAAPVSYTTCELQVTSAAVVPAGVWCCGAKGGTGATAGGGWLSICIAPHMMRCTMLAALLRGHFCAACRSDKQVW
jgi:hypothetical protein